ncbi:putative crotonobetaine/carnitine-CoA ligase [Chlamydia trachomatis]|nr:putative crotonobetaine/carnitine-CoA ligase [Chlamydia trachomatis]
MVIDYCAQHLSSFKVPGIVEIRDSLPHTCSMKVEKRLLKTRHCETGGGDER